MRRRQALKHLAAIGIGNVIFQRALAAELTQDNALTSEALRQAEWISGITLTETEREQLRDKVDRLRERLHAVRAFELDPQVAPAMRFQVDRMPPATATRPDISVIESHPPQLPPNNEALAFLPLSELSALIRTRRLTSLELTECYLDRLRRHDETLHCVVNLTPELALTQAARADAEIAAGRYRGPLHGIPWGAKDLIAYPGYPTTWGAPQFRQRVLPDKATVAQRLDDAGAVLVAKLSLGALAMGDQWYGGKTRNPWNPDEGSSGSSAGSAAAVAAGLVGFALGSETLGSIISPCRRCGTTGLRPTFGRVSRHGCMALTWSMDKIGPITRSVEDAALVLGAIHGADGLDPTAADAPFSWPERQANKTIRIGYLEGEANEDALAVLKELGFTLLPSAMPKGFPVWAMNIILTAEAATAFHEFTRDGVTEGLNTWPDEFRKGHFIPAVDYLRANRIRSRLMSAMTQLFQNVDVFLGGGRDELAMSNLTGHPSVVIPNGFIEEEGKKRVQSLKFTGACFGETSLLQVAHAYQTATGHHLQRPPGFG